MKQWKMASPSSETVALLCREQIPPLTAHLLAVRRITTIEAARNFLRGDDELSDPFLLQDMDQSGRTHWKSGGRRAENLYLR